MLSKNNRPGSVGEAQNKIFELLTAEQAKPAEQKPAETTEQPAEAQPTEEAEAIEPTEETQAVEPVETEAEEQPLEDSEDYADPDTLYEVKVNGQTLEVPLEQLIENFSKGEDYTNKTKALSEKVKTEAQKLADERTAEFQKRQTDYVEKLVALESQIAQPPVTKEELQELINNEDFDEYHRRKFSLDQHTEKLTTIKKAKADELVKLQEEQAKQFNDYRAKEMTILLDKMPELKDQAVVAKLSQYLMDNDFSEHEVQNAADHRALVMAEKARKWDELQASSKAKKVPKKAPRVIRKVGSSIQKKAESQKRFENSRQKLQQSGKMRDAANIFEAMINNNQM